MKSSPIFAAFIVVLFLSSAAADKITIPDGNRMKNITGTILAVNAEKIIVDVNGQRQEIPAHTVLATVYDKEPPLLNTVRSAVRDSRTSEALEALTKIDRSTLGTPEMRQEFDYFQALTQTRSVFSGSGNADEAENALSGFMKNNKSSYHYYEICELYGDLMVNVNKFDAAKISYTELAKAPWAEYHLKAKVSLGMAEIGEGKIDSARKHFEDVIAELDATQQTEKTETNFAKFKGMSQIGWAQCLAAEKKQDEAVAQLVEVAQNYGSEDSAFQSVLYNSLGSIYAQSGKPQEAIRAYLHTDILFFSAKTEHIKALTELSKLWKEVKRPDRANAVAQRLKNLYNVGK